jgi:hypothetical protein
MPPPATVVHELPGRIRIRVPSRRGDAPYFEAAAEALARCPLVEAVRFNPLAGSLLLLHRSDRESIREYAEARGLFSVRDEPELGSPATTTTAALHSMLGRFDDALLGATRNTGDLRTVTFLALVGAAALQFARGNVLPAGVTLLHYAMDALPQRPGTDERGTT